VQGFTEKKFLKLSSYAQHKKCSEWLRCIIEIPFPLNQSKIEHYEQLCTWMKFDPLKSYELEVLADRYHAHVVLSQQSLREDHFLNVGQQDRLSPIDPYLDIAVYLDNLRSAHNVGSIIRSAEFFGFNQVIINSNSPNISKQLARSSMGCENWIDTQINKPLVSCPRPWIAIETCELAPPLDRYSFPLSFTLVMGNEEYGLKDEMLRACDECLRIPQHGRKNSLNVSVAFSICAYEIRRQLRQKDPT
jgi:tRNA G18 (ribose-2'-O)-methylase SpoU